MRANIWLITSLAILALAAVAIPLAKNEGEQFRGAPIFRDYGFGVLIFAAVVVLFSSQRSSDLRLRLVGFAVVAGFVGYSLGAAQFD